MKRMLTSVFLFCICMQNTAGATSVERVSYSQSHPERKGYLCKPKGEGPFPAVIYNHGGMGQKLGGDPRGTCKALARSGFVALSPLRRKTRSLRGHPQDVMAALQFMKRQKSVDGNRLGMIGFSRGALLTYMISTRTSELKAIVIMAPAPGRNTLERFLSRSADVDAASLILVANNDRAALNREGQDHVALSRKLHQSLKKQGKDTRLIVYPAYRNNGHDYFQQLRDYWSDVNAFLQEKLAKKESD